MGFVGDLVGGVVGGITGASDSADAASEAGDLQYQAAIQGIDEQRRQFDISSDQSNQRFNDLVNLMSPYVQAGTGGDGQIGSLQAMQNLMGLGQAGAQPQAIRNLQDTPGFQEMIAQGENAILQNASATGGLRGGNTQDALARYRPMLLRQAIEDQLSRLSGITSLSQNAAAMQGNSGINVAQNQGALGANAAGNISNLLQQGGAAQAGGILAQGNRNQQAFGDLTSLAGTAVGLGLGF